MHPIEIPTIPQPQRLADTGSRSRQTLNGETGPSAIEPKSGEWATEELTPVVEAAVAQMESVDDVEPKMHQEVTFKIVDLPGDVLGRALGQMMQREIAVVGHGWLVNTTPGDDGQFVQSNGIHERTTLSGSRTLGRADLLTAVLDELGGVFGGGHEDDGIMEQSLDPNGVLTSQPRVSETAQPLNATLGDE